MKPSFSEPEYIFRVGEKKDIYRLLELNEKWQQDKIEDFSKKDGFLSARFSENDLDILVNNNEVVVVEHKGTVVGYYLLNNFCLTKKYFEAKNVVSRLYDSNKLSKEMKVGMGAQTVIDISHQGKGLSRPMLNILLDIVKSKYNYLYSSISKKNEKAFNIHSKEGWFVIDENEECYYVLYKISDRRHHYF